MLNVGYLIFPAEQTRTHFFLLRMNVWSWISIKGNFYQPIFRVAFLPFALSVRSLLLQADLGRYGFLAGFLEEQRQIDFCPALELVIIFLHTQDMHAIGL